MLPVIAHNPENWKRFAPICLRCGQLDTRTGLCSIGIYHTAHINAGYCPQGEFGPGSDVRPEVWPVAEHARIIVCRACPAFAKNFCGDDGASILAHARQAICPQGRYADGAVGKIEVATPAMPATAVGGEGCCGG